VNKKDLVTIFILVATELIGFGLIIPILPQISKQFSSSGLWIGCLLSSYSFAQFIAAPILGQLSDHYGRKPILILSKLGTIASYILLANASTYFWLLASRLLDGFTGGNIAVARAYLSDITDKEHRSKAMAIIGVAFGTGFIIGPAIGGICYKLANNFSIAGYIGALLSFFSLLITQLALKEPSKKLKATPVQSTDSQAKLSGSSIIILCVSFIGMIIFSGFETSFSVYTEHKFGFNESQNSLMFFMIGIAAFIIQGSFTKISISPIQKAITIGLGAIGVGLILTNIIKAPIPSLASLCFLLFGISILNTHLPAELSSLSKQKGLILGTYESVSSMARILGPLLIFTTLFKKLSIIYVVLGVFALISCVIFLFIQYMLDQNMSEKT